MRKLKYNKGHSISARSWHIEIPLKNYYYRKSESRESWPPAKMSSLPESTGKSQRLVGHFIKIGIRIQIATGTLVPCLKIFLVFKYQILVFQIQYFSPDNFIFETTTKSLSKFPSREARSAWALCW